MAEDKEETMAPTEPAAAERPRRIQLRRTKGWRMPPNTVKVDRTTKWGNPYIVKEAREAGYGGTDHQLAAWCVDLFRRAAISNKTGEYDPRVRSAAEIRAALSGKNLACWCRPDAPCHADVLLKIANAAAGSNGEARTPVLRPANLPTHSVVLHDGSGNRLVADVEAQSPSEALSKVLDKIRPEERQNWSEARKVT